MTKEDFDVTKKGEEINYKISLYLRSIGTIQFPFFELHVILSGKVKESCNGVLIPVRWTGKKEHNCLWMICVGSFFKKNFQFPCQLSKDMETDKLRCHSDLTLFCPLRFLL